jgi:predicted amidohydrolase
LVQGGAADKNENLAVAKRVVEEAVQKGANIVLFPELFLNGYEAGSLLHEGAEKQNGPSIQVGE